MTAGTFTNDTLTSADIPEADSIEFEALDARYSRVLVFEWLLVWLLPTIGWTVLYGRNIIESSVLSGFWPHLLPLVLLIPVFIICPMFARHCGYALRERDVHYRHGVIWQKRIALPFCRIQHVEIERNPLERMFGLATLKFFTAGGGSADMKIPALHLQKASKLKAFVLKSAGEADDRA